METEVKIQVSTDEFASARRRLKDLGSRTLSDRAREENLLFDYPDGRIHDSGCALRLRRYGEQTLLTFKGPVQKDSSYKKREEFETEVGNAEEMEAVLNGLGLSIRSRYQKTREIHSCPIDGRPVAFCLDETPAGLFVELEGDEAGIEAALRDFGWTRKERIRKSYPEIYREHSEPEKDR